jgi:hypothetical protein
MKIKYPQAEELMQQFSKYLEEKGDLRRLTNNSWRVNFFKPEPVEEDKSTVTDAKE